MVGTYLLTGGRKEEILGLERADVDLDLDAGWIHFRPNRWRGLKSRHATRAVPLWSQLRPRLTSSLERHDPKVLPFPSHLQRVERPYAALEDALAGAVARAKIEKNVTWHTLRHTYCAHRLYTLEGGAPVSAWDVACELGHRDTGMIERVYGHVLRDRDRRGARGAEVRYEVARVLRFPAAGAAT